jgi:hypothetical protein
MGDYLPIPAILENSQLTRSSISTQIVLPMAIQTIALIYTPFSLIFGVDPNFTTDSSRPDNTTQQLKTNQLRV